MQNQLDSAIRAERIELLAPALDTIRTRPAWVSSRGVIRSMQERDERRKRWGWLMDWFGL